MLCNKPIEIVPDRIVVYCVLLIHHEGKCEPERPPCRTCRTLEKYWSVIDSKKDSRS